jgi:ATP adenylyltransferase
MYHQAYDLTIKASVSSAGMQGLSPENSRRLTISYNLAFTDRVMVLCPRVSEGPEIESPNGNVIGPIALNGTILGGTLLVKSEEEWQSLRSDPSKLRDILSMIGIPALESEDKQRL